MNCKAEDWELTWMSMAIAPSTMLCASPRLSRVPIAIAGTSSTSVILTPTPNDHIATPTVQFLLKKKYIASHIAKAATPSLNMRSM